MTWNCTHTKKKLFSPKIGINLGAAALSSLSGMCFGKHELYLVSVPEVGWGWVQKLTCFAIETLQLLYNPQCLC